MKTKITREIMETIIQSCITAPESQISKTIVEDFKNVLENLDSYSDEQLFDFINNVSRNSCCEISGFVKTICALDNYYTRPVEEVIESEPLTQTSMKDLIDQAVQIECSNIDKSIDFVLDFLFEEIDKGNYQWINDGLKSIRIEDLSIQMLVTILTFTLVAADKLPQREEFFNSVKKKVISQDGKDRADRLFKGFGWH